MATYQRSLAMRLYVYVLEARGLAPPRRRHGGDVLLCYAKVTVGKQRFRTQAVEAAAAAVAWNEEVMFAVGADGAAEGEEELEVTVARRRRGGRGREVVGTARLPVPAATAAAAPGEMRSVPPTWFTLQPVGERRKGGDADDAAADCGACSSLLSRARYA